MTTREHLKLDLMVFAINHDFFGYGSICSKQANGRWVSIVDGEKFVESGKQLAADWDTLEEDDKKNILEYFAKEELKLDIDLWGGK